MSKPVTANPVTDLDYLARTIYGEARGQSMASKLAVGWVIRNRLITGRWGSTYKDVVTARLQFTCWSESKDPANYAAIMSPSGTAWTDSVTAANEVANADVLKDTVPDATHYYSPNAQAALHKSKPGSYPEIPAFTNSPAVQVPNPPDVPADSFKFYKNVP